MSKKVTVYTKAYNTEPYLRQCIDSVLSQSYADFEYILVDNGCTDGSGSIMANYARQDSRIRLIRYAENQRIDIQELMISKAAGEWLAVLDSDDWWEPDYLERLLRLAEENQLDIACTGTKMHHMESGAESFRKVSQTMLFSKRDFAPGLPWYHAFFRTVWGKLVRMECLRAVPKGAVPGLSYGRDTLWCFQFLRHAGRMGIDNSVLHHYRIHERSASYRYDAKRFEADVYLYDDAIRFLSAFGPVSAQNRNFLQCVYANAITDTVGVIQNSKLSSSERLREYHAIAANPVTIAAYRECADESAVQSKSWLIAKTLEAGFALKDQDDSGLRGALQTLLPGCGPAVTGANIGLFQEDTELLQALLRDDADAVMQNLLERMERGRGIKKYALPQMIQALAVNDPLLCQIDDTAFLRKYGGIYWKVWRGERLSALEEMAGLLLDNQVRSGRETFLQLFLSLAAVLEQPSAFIFAKLQLGRLYLSQKRLSECRAVAAELEELGLSNDEELKELERCL